MSTGEREDDGSSCVDEEDEEDEEKDEEDEDEKERRDEIENISLSALDGRYSERPSATGQKGKGKRVDSPFDSKLFGRLHTGSDYASATISEDTRNNLDKETHESAQHITSEPASTVQNPRTAQHGRSTVKSLPADIQAQLRSLERRFIQTDPSNNDAEVLDARYRRVASPHHAYFFVPGRVFKMLWTEPAGQANPGKTRNSTHFSTVWLGDRAFSEIRHFVVVRNKGTFSQCIPIQTYKGIGAAKAGLIMADHGIIHTSFNPPNQLPREMLTKYSIRVQPSKDETLHPASRINYGKAYAVEHNVKVLDVGMVVEAHRYLLAAYFDAAMRGEE